MEATIRHFRITDSHGVIENRGGATIAYQDTAGGAIEYTVAYCNPVDNFSRMVGRNAALGRLLSPLHSRIIIMSVEEFEDALDAVSNTWQDCTESLARHLNEVIEADVPAAYLHN